MQPLDICIYFLPIVASRFSVGDDIVCFCSTTKLENCSKTLNRCKIPYYSKAPLGLEEIELDLNLITI